MISGIETVNWLKHFGKLKIRDIEIKSIARRQK